MSRLKTRLLLFATATALLAQMSSRSMETDMRRAGSRLACQCGCTHTVASCDMFECSFSKPAKQRIMKMQQAGMSDQAIIDAFIQEHGQKIFRGAPSSWGRAVPYLALVPGMLMIFWFVRRYYHKPAPAAAPAVEEGDYARYREQIEKDLARLD
jgi:cytochrome c-type biogenesis protein CcmH/NrfF